MPAGGRDKIRLRIKALKEAGWRRSSRAVPFTHPQEHRLCWSHPEPSPRDWFVATSIVRWMATNVGRCMFQEAMRLADKEIKNAREEDPNILGGSSGSR